MYLSLRETVLLSPVRSLQSSSWLYGHVINDLDSGRAQAYEASVEALR